MTPVRGVCTGVQGRSNIGHIARGRIDMTTSANHRESKHKIKGFFITVVLRSCGSIGGRADQ